MDVPKHPSTKWRAGAGLLAAAALFYLAFTAVRMYRRPPAEPLVPVDQRQAGAFAMPTFGVGDPWSLEQQRGKVVVVNFMATWCPPCIEETPDFVAVARAYASRGVVFVAVCLDQDEPRDQAIQQFVKDHELPYPVLVPPKESIAWARGVPIPQTFLFDRHGRRAQAVSGKIDGSTLKEWLDQLLREPA